MIIFLYGKDSYRLKQNLEKIVNEYKNKYSGLALSVLDLNEIGELTKLEDSIKTVSFFDEKQLLVVKNAFGEANKIAELIKIWDLVNDKQRILVFVENADETQLTKQDKELLTLLTTAPNLTKYMKPLEGKQLESWVVKEFKSAGVESEPAAIKKLISFAGPDSWQLGQEITKLANYKDGDGKGRPRFTEGGPWGNSLITADDIDLLVCPKEDFNIFQIVDAVAAKNKLKSVALLHGSIRAGEDPFYIFSMIAYQFRNLLRVKSLVKNAVPYNGIIKKTGLNPFVVKKTFDQCRGYDLDELRQLFALLARLDVEAKSGAIDMEDGLYRFVFSLTD